MVKFNSKKKMLKAKWRRIIDERKGIRPRKYQQFRRDLSIRVLSLGRGPALWKCPGKSRQKPCIRLKGITMKCQLEI